MSKYLEAIALLFRAFYILNIIASSPQITAPILNIDSLVGGRGHIKMIQVAKGE
jgi:hypothetical protein